MAVVKVQELMHTYTNGIVKESVLNGVSLSFEGGKVYALMGPSGSGKTTLLNIIGGILRPTSGQVLIEGQDIVHMNEKSLGKLRLNKVGYIFQSFNLLPFLTVEENVLLPLRLSGKDIAPYSASFDFLLGELGMTDKKQCYIHELSGGQQQRVAIARCLLAKPKVILADEPTGNLDSGNAAAFMRLLVDMTHKSGITVILVTHDDQVADYADEIIRMKDGQLYDAGKRGYSLPNTVNHKGEIQI